MKSTPLPSAWAHESPPTILLVFAVLILTLVVHFGTATKTQCSDETLRLEQANRCLVPGIIPVKMPHGSETLYHTA